MEFAQLQQRAGGQLPNTGGAAAAAVGQQRRRHELQTLPIARDGYGRSPFAQSLHSPRSTMAVRATTPKASSPANQLLESLTPKSTTMEAFSLQEKKMVPHLERCLQAVNGTCSKKMKAGLTSRPALLQAVNGGDASVVACEGSPTARALSRAFPECKPAKYSQPEAALSALEGRQVQRALLPVESSTSGTVHRTYDLLLRYKNIHIVGELVQQRLCEKDDEEAECGRFWVLSRDMCVVGGAEAASFKTTVAMVLREGLGALHKALAAFAFRDINVSKVESRPWRAQPLAAATGPVYFQYVLFIEFESSTASRAAQNALAHLQEHASFLRMLGSYPCFHISALGTPRPQPPPLVPQFFPFLQVGTAS